MLALICQLLPAGVSGVPALSPLIMTESPLPGPSLTLIRVGSQHPEPCAETTELVRDNSLGGVRRRATWTGATEVNDVRKPAAGDVLARTAPGSGPGLRGFGVTGAR